ncbi:EFR1 family ferrodoxin [Mycoplasmatota bacterium]|nr:EFR1 family ferrodoxin [Mycoplasmatota bacterium]
MKIALIYFSGTGNTEYVARYIKQNLEDVHLFNIEKIKDHDFKSYDTLIFGYPVYACYPPKNVKEVLKSFPEGNQSVYIYSTKGFYNGISLNIVSKILKKKGYLVKGILSIKMPGSDGLAMMKKDSKTLKKMITKDFEHLSKIDKWIKIIKNNKKQYSLINPLNYLISYSVKGVYNLVEKKMKDKFYADSTCTHCHLCEKNCPMNNISVTDTKVVFNKNCILCLRCLHQCPNESIQIGKITKGKYRYKGPTGDFKANH